MRSLLQVGKQSSLCGAAGGRGGGGGESLHAQPSWAMAQAQSAAEEGGQRLETRTASPAYLAASMPPGHACAISCGTSGAR
jgi:hypothetical protein